MRLPWQRDDWPAPMAHLAALRDGIDFEPWLKHGNLPRWLDTLAQLPAATVDQTHLDRWVGPRGQCDDPAALADALQQLKPWRKGPYRLFDREIDSEWRSDLKWDRIVPHLPPAGGHALDVGCGNGYHMWRLLEHGMDSVLGVDPSLLFAIQFAAIQQYLRHPAIEYWPVPLESLAPSQHFDLVLSMGVLYHRRSPIEHLTQLRQQMAPGATLVLETLVIDGDENSVLVPPDRYARMKNCWFIPSVAALQVWCRKLGFEQVDCVDLTATTGDEQRSTDWVGGDSLAGALDPADPSRTLEGHPAPLRATLICR